MESDRRFLKTLLLAVVIVGGVWVLMNKDRIKQPGDVVGLVQEQMGTDQIDWGGGSSQQSQARNPFGSASYQSRPVSSANQIVTNVVRIASFKVQPRQTVTHLDTLASVAQICRRYDAIAIQTDHAHDSNWLARLTERMNAIAYDGSLLNAQSASSNRARYTFISDEGRGRDQAVVSAIIYNQATLEMDRSRWYTVNDPEKVLTNEPIVGWFRTKGPKVDQAFTFTLANLKLHSRNPEKELAHLGELFRAIRNDGRGEDDVLIVGDFNAGDRGLLPTGKKAGLTWVVSNRPTTTRNDSQADNLIFNDVATSEFTGRGGVFDFMRFYNLRLEDAVGISEHLPVWAEFSIFEGKAFTGRRPNIHSPSMPEVQGPSGLNAQRSELTNQR